MNKPRVIQVLDRLKEQFPNPKTMLDYNSLSELLVAIVLSAQSTDEQVNKVTKKLFAEYSTLEDFAYADIHELEELIKGVGIYRNKAKNIKALSNMVLEEYKGEIPSTLEELTTLPGVGRKTANVMLAVGFNLPGLGIDTHVRRVANRIGLVALKDPTKIELSLKDQIPRTRWAEAHHLLILHGRQVCKARKPDCNLCTIADICDQVLDDKSL
ncbi:MAG TPA: endonuclease III [Syntrophomonadaceae bacterium]|nr:endonuclease III [Syntrophomonadaceae bacterium]